MRVRTHPEHGQVVTHDGEVVGVCNGWVDALTAIHLGIDAKDCRNDTTPPAPVLGLMVGHARTLGCTPKAARILNRWSKGAKLKGQERPKPDPKKKPKPKRVAKDKDAKAMYKRLTAEGKLAAPEIFRQVKKKFPRNTVRLKK